MGDCRHCQSWKPWRRSSLLNDYGRYKIVSSTVHIEASIHGSLPNRLGKLSGLEEPTRSAWTPRHLIGHFGLDNVVPRYVVKISSTDNTGRQSKRYIRFRPSYSGKRVNRQVEKWYEFGTLDKLFSRLCIVYGGP